jgi:hypothetical protein
MKSVNAFCLVCLLLTPALAWSKPEVIIGGVQYSSIEDYKRAGKAKGMPRGAVAVSQEEQQLRAQTEELGITFDPKQVKTVTVMKEHTIELKPEEQKAVKLLHSASYEQGLNSVKTDFSQNWNDPVPKFNLKAQDLADQMHALAGDRSEPVLIIAEPHKLRVMALKEAVKN